MGRNSSASSKWERELNPRLRRLQSDFELVRDVFSGHPHVTVNPVGTRLPPETYRIEYRLRGLYLNGEQPEFRDVHEVELMLPRRYPAEKPYAVPTTPIFHPNIREYFCIADYWAAGTTLVDVIAKMGDMIQWRIYNIASPLDGIAARWAAQQEGSDLLPIGNVDLGVAEVEVEVRSRTAETKFEDLPVASATEEVDDAAVAASPLGADDFEITLRRD